MGDETTRQEFVRRIIKEYSNLSLWTIFADWLEENGELDKAQVVRIHCEFARGVVTPKRRMELMLELSQIQPKMYWWWQ